MREMKSNRLNYAHLVNVLGWTFVTVFFTIVGQIGKPAFLLLVTSVHLFAVGLSLYISAAKHPKIAYVCICESYIFGVEINCDTAGWMIKSGYVIKAAITLA